MQEQQTSELRPRDKDYVPIVERACDKVKGFSELYKELERSISISGKSQSALINYSRQLAHLAIHYNCSPMDLEHDQVMDFLHLVKSRRRMPDPADRPSSSPLFLWRQSIVLRSDQRWRTPASCHRAKSTCGRSRPDKSYSRRSCLSVGRGTTAYAAC